MSEPTGICELCGEPMPKGEEMFKFHGYSCDCPKPPLARPTPQPTREAMGPINVQKARDWIKFAKQEVSGLRGPEAGQLSKFHAAIQYQRFIGILEEILDDNPYGPYGLTHPPKPPAEWMEAAAKEIALAAESADIDGHYLVAEEIRAIIAKHYSAPVGAGHVTIADLSETQITALRGILMFFPGNSHQKFSIGDHNDAGGFGIPLEGTEGMMTHLPKNFVVVLFLRILQLPKPETKS